MASRCGAASLKSLRSPSPAWCGESRRGGDGEGAGGEGRRSAQRQRAADKASRRAAHLAKVPAEPPVGEAGSCKICVHVPGDVQHWRRFGSWHTLQDLAHFAASLVDGAISPSNRSEEHTSELQPLVNP